MRNLRFIENVTTLQGKKVLLRVDFNVRIDGGQVTEDFRIVKSMKTIDFLLKKGAKVILVSHIDKKEGGSLEPVSRYLTQFYPRLRFIDSPFSEEGKKEIDSLVEGGILLLENIRHFEEEEQNSTPFAEALAGVADLYVNDAFSVSHREHASIVGVPKFIPGFAGFQLKEEIEGLSKVNDPDHPFLFILGGAKFDTKLPLVEKFMGKADKVFIGGALANDLFKAKGYFVGESLVSETPVDLDAILQSPKVVIPEDVVATYKGIATTKDPEKISVGEKIVDIGEKTAGRLFSLISESKFVLWNGPMGKNELGFKRGSQSIADAILASHAYSIVGGGDTISLLSDMNAFDKFSFVSTGGGAMLDFLLYDTLPGIEALVQTKKKEVFEPTRINLGKEKSFFQKIFSFLKKK